MNVSHRERKRDQIIKTTQGSKYIVKVSKSVELTNLNNLTPLLSWQLERKKSHSDYNLDKTEAVLKMLIACR